MKQVSPAVVIGIAVVACLLLAFSIYRFAGGGGASAADMRSLTPKPREGSPTFAPLPGEHVLGRGAGVKGAAVPAGP